MGGLKIDCKQGSGLLCRSQRWLSIWWQRRDPGTRLSAGLRDRRRCSLRCWGGLELQCDWYPVPLDYTAHRECGESYADLEGGSKLLNVWDWLQNVGVSNRQLTAAWLCIFSPGQKSDRHEVISFDRVGKSGLELAVTVQLNSNQKSKRHGRTFR